jgi:hypothetical protein
VTAARVVGRIEGPLTKKAPVVVCFLLQVLFSARECASRSMSEMVERYLERRQTLIEHQFRRIIPPVKIDGKQIGN